VERPAHHHRARREAGAAHQSSAYLAPLSRLVDLDIAAGGDGRVEAADLERLSPPEKSTLGEAFLSVPAGYGTVSGTWSARLQNVFYPEDDYVVQLEIDLRQNSRSLSRRGRSSSRARRSPSR